MKAMLVFVGFALISFNGYASEVRGLPSTGTNAAPEVRITTLCDNLPLSSALDDVLRAYGLHAVVVVRPEDSDLHTAPTRDVILKGCSPRQYFTAITNIFSGYGCSYDAATGCWFIAPEDELGRMFKKAVTVDVSKVTNVAGGVAAYMGSISNTFRIPNINDGWWRSDIEDRILVTHREPMSRATNCGFDRPVGTGLWWQGVARMLQQMPRSYLFIYSFVGRNPPVAEERNWRFAEDLPGGADREVKVSQEGVKPNVDLDSGAFDFVRTNLFWSFGSTMDCAAMSNREIINVAFPDSTGEVNWQIAPQMLRMSEERLLALYRMTDPSRRRNIFGSSLLRAPQIKYTDAAIRMTLGFICSTEHGIPPLDVLIHNCYSTEMMDFVTALIANGSPRWKGLAYFHVRYAPASIPKERRDAWLAAMEVGRLEQIAMDVEQSCRPKTDGLEGQVSPEILAALRSRLGKRSYTDEEKEKMRAQRSADEMSPQTLRNTEAARQSVERRRERHLQVLGIDTNRSMAWVWEAAGIPAPTNGVRSLSLVPRRPTDQ